MNLGYKLCKLIWRQAWLSPKYKKNIYKKLCRYGESPDAPFSINFFGLRYEGNLSNSIEFNIFYYAAFEKPLLFFLRDTLLNLREIAQSTLNQLFCDVGANIGQHSLFMSGYAAQVHAFEPYPPVAQKLLRHIKLNNINNIHLHAVGLSDKTEQLNYFAPTGRNQGIGSFDASTVSKGNTDSGKLSLVRGDEYFRQNQIEGISLLKIDVEGFEKRTIAGLQSTLLEQRPIIVCEVTYGNELAFASTAELIAALPPEYQLHRFNTRKADGSKARRRGARARRSGAYELVPFANWRDSGQDDIVACPVEKAEFLPLKNRRGPN